MRMICSDVRDRPSSSTFPFCEYSGPRKGSHRPSRMLFPSSSAIFRADGGSRSESRSSTTPAEMPQ